MTTLESINIALMCCLLLLVGCPPADLKSNDNPAPMVEHNHSHYHVHGKGIKHDQFLLCDGSVHAVNEEIEFDTYQALGTMNGAETAATVN